MYQRHPSAEKNVKSNLISCHCVFLYLLLTFPFLYIFAYFFVGCKSGWTNSVTFQEPGIKLLSELATLIGTLQAFLFPS